MIFQISIEILWEMSSVLVREIVSKPLQNSRTFRFCLILIKVKPKEKSPQNLHSRKLTQSESNQTKKK